MSSLTIIKIIEDQRAKGEVTLTHSEMTRFWITLDQGIDFVLMALEKMVGGEIFVPKIPSMKVRSLIQIIAPECRIKIIGMRPGEKLHEILVTPEESRHTKEYDDYFVILPEHDWWSHHEHYNAGKLPPENFYFASHNNKQWLDEEGLKRLLESI